MKKLIKILAKIVLVILIIGIIAFLFINFRGIPSYDTKNIDYTHVATPESLKRGKKLALMLCANCHKDQNSGKLIGTKMLDAPPEFGEIFSANITQDKTYGIGEWTDGEIVRLLRTGIKRDGKYAPPYMAKLPTMADEDINAIISFLRSEDPLVNADATPDKPTKPSFLTKMLCNIVWKPFPMPTEPIKLPDTTQTIALGKYLAHNLDCFSCHSADFKTNDFMQPELSEGYFAGGNKPLNREGKIKLTQNLTPDKETGIGNWTKEQFIKAVKYGIKDGEKALEYPMVPYSLLSDTEANAIFEYLKTLEPVHNEVKRSIYD